MGKRIWKKGISATPSCFPLRQITLWHSWHLLYNHNERNAAELSVRGSRQGTDSFVYYRSRYLEEIPACVLGKINRAYTGMRFAYDGNFHIHILPCEVECSVAPGEAVLSPPSARAPQRETRENNASRNRILLKGKVKSTTDLTKGSMCI